MEYFYTIYWIEKKWELKNFRKIWLKKKIQSIGFSNFLFITTTLLRVMVKIDVKIYVQIKLIEKWFIFKITSLNLINFISPPKKFLGWKNAWMHLNWVQSFVLTGGSDWKREKFKMEWIEWLYSFESLHEQKIQ